MYPIHPFWRSTIFVAYILSQYVQIHHWPSILIQIIAFLSTNDEMHAPRKPKEETFAVKKIHASDTFSILQSVLSKTQELSKIGFWREMLWDRSKIFFNCSSSLEISVESLELGLCKVLSKLTSEIRETTLVTILWMRLSLRVARARAEQWGRPRHHSTSIPLVTPSSPKPPPLLFLFSEVVSSVLRGCSLCCCEKKVLSPPKRGQLSLFGCLHFPLLLALAISNIFLLSITGPTSGLESDCCAILAWLQQ